MKLIVLASLPFMALVGGANAADPHDVFGKFATDDGGSHVLIEDCGDGSPCGTVVWVDPADLDEGETPESLRTPGGDPVVGLMMLHSFERKAKDWRGGTIYSPEDDKTYRSRLRRLEDNTLQVKGCIGPLCQAQIWTEVP